MGTSANPLSALGVVDPGSTPSALKPPTYTQTMVHPKTGDVYDIPADKVDDATRKGLEHSVPMYNDKGEPYDIPVSKVPSASKQGLRSAPPAGAETPGAGARFSEVTTGTQHPVAQAESELEQLKEHPLGTIARAAGQAAMMPVNFADNLVRHPIDTVTGLTGGPQFSDDVQKKNFGGALGDIAGGFANAAMLAAPVAEPIAEEAAKGFPQSKGAIRAMMPTGKGTPAAGMPQGVGMSVDAAPLAKKTPVTSEGRGATWSDEDVIADARKGDPEAARYAVLRKKGGDIPNLRYIAKARLKGESTDLVPGESTGYPEPSPRRAAQRMTFPGGAPTMETRGPNDTPITVGEEGGVPHQPQDIGDARRMQNIANDPFLHESESPENRLRAVMQNPAATVEDREQAQLRYRGDKRKF